MIFSLIIIIITLIICVIHLFKFGIEDRYDIDFLLIFVLLICNFIYTLILCF